MCSRHQVTVVTRPYSPKFQASMSGFIGEPEPFQPSPFERGMPGALCPQGSTALGLAQVHVDTICIFRVFPFAVIGHALEFVQPGG